MNNTKNTIFVVLFITLTILFIGIVIAVQNSDTQNEKSSCSQDIWTCSGWGECFANSFQTRSCTLTTDCPNVYTPKPIEKIHCESKYTQTLDNDLLNAIFRH